MDNEGWMSTPHRKSALITTGCFHSELRFLKSRSEGFCVEGWTLSTRPPLVSQRPRRAHLVAVCLVVAVDLTGTGPTRVSDTDLARLTARVAAELVTSGDLDHHHPQRDDPPPRVTLASTTGASSR